MWQTPPARQPQRTPRRRNHLGTLACLFSVLLLGIVIGRVTYRSDRPDELLLHHEPAQPTRTAGKVRATSEAHPDDRPSLNLVARPQPTPRRSVTAAPTPTSSVSRPKNMIDGSFGDGGLIAPGDEPTLDDTPPTLVGIENRYIRLINRERRRAGCRALRVDQRLMASARAHSAEMAASGYFHHDSPDGTSPWERMAAAGYANGGAENIARGYQTAEEAVRGWMADRGHRGNILDCRLVATGVGVVAGEGGPWWTQDFGYS